MIVLIIQLNFTFQGNELETMYIVPETFNTSACSGERCITLSQLARSINVVTPKQSLTLIFFHGYHMLDLDVHIFNISELYLISSNTCLSSQASITCQHNSRFRFENTGHVVIENLTFLGCVNNILSCGQLTAEDVTFFGHSGSGTTLEVIKTSAYVVNCSFIYNRVGNYRGPIKDPFNSSASVFVHVGGAMISNESNVIIVNSLFEGNCAEVGGAIFLTMGSNVTIINSVLTNNSVDKFHTSILSFAYGGALFCESGDSITKSTVTLIKCELYDNSAEFEGCGGVIFTNNCVLNARLSKFCDSMADIAGVLVAYGDSTIAIDSCEFWNNTVITPLNLHSGVIATYASVVNINKSIFDSNRAFSGGVMSLFDPPSIVTIHQSEFKNNYARFGGVLSVSSKDSRTTIIKSFFDKNSGNTQGGVLDAQVQSTVTFTECIFSNNHANIFTGGAICVSNTKNLTITGSQFINNSAINYVGGVIHLQGAHLMLENTSLRANKALSGGAIYLSE